jgi:hypothetical protein
MQIQIIIILNMNMDYAPGAINQYHVVLPTNALPANSSSTSHALSYPVRYNTTLCIQTTPSFSKHHQRILDFVMPVLSFAKDSSPTTAIVAISSLISNVLPFGQLNLTTVTNMNSFPSFSKFSSRVNSVVRIAATPTRRPRYVAFVNTCLTLYVL